ncbi:hypothetical protein [Lyngbya aestuarii]|uniref:hypothetical protein n=1 Tax=Lyngbya aestuarii TaxID=118322 RepID=UPI00403D8BE5
MRKSKLTVRLKSVGVAKVLLWLLRIFLALDGLSVILTLIELAIPVNPPTIVTLQHLLNDLLIPSLVLSLATLLLLFVWIYRLHKDLHQCYSSYPIAAWDSLCRFILPGFNLWGIWNTLMTIAHYFKAETDSLRRCGFLLYRLVPVMYAIFIASYLLKRLIYRYDYLGRVESIRDIPEFFVTVAIAAKELLSLSGVIILIAITQTIVNAMQLKFIQISRANDVNFS